jgi:hypothetical protein
MLKTGAEKNSTRTFAFFVKIDETEVIIFGNNAVTITFVKMPNISGD